MVPRLPARICWLDDGEFCGVITLRFVPGSDALPDYVSGHIGYAVVPWKRRRGYATRALALLLPVAREVGLKRVEITCDDDNEASRRVILKNGGELIGTRPEWSGKTKLVFRIDLGNASELPPKLPLSPACGGGAAWQNLPCLRGGNGPAALAEGGGAA